MYNIVNIAYLRVKHYNNITLRSTLYLILMSMSNYFIALVAMTLLCGDVLIKLNLGKKVIYQGTNIDLGFKSTLKYCQQNRYIIMYFKKMYIRIPRLRVIPMYSSIVLPKLMPNRYVVNKISTVPEV